MSSPSEIQEFQPPEPSRGCSFPALLVLGLLGGLVILVCAGMCGLGMYLFLPSETTVAEDIAQIQREIIELELPDFLEPILAQKIDNLFVTARLCVYRHRQGRGLLRIAAVDWSGGDEKKLEQEWLEELSQLPVGDDPRRLEVSQSETREITVGQQSVPFRFEEGQDLSSATRYRQVIGDFTTAAGSVRLFLQLEAEVWEEDAVIQLLNSLK